MSVQHQATVQPAGQEGHSHMCDANLPDCTHPCHPTPGHAPTQGRQQLRKNNKRAYLNIATLNMNGYTAPSHSLNGIGKWATIIRTMNRLKIAILAIQETHLDES